MLSTCSKACVSASACGAAAAKLAADPAVKPAANPKAASLRAIDLLMAFSSKAKRWTVLPD
jgi:hypothetical protein